MSAALYNELNAHAVAIHVPAGEMLFSAGARALRVYLIREGRVALIWQATNNLHPMDVVGAGQIVGLPAALNGEYSVGARAVIDCELGVLDADDAVDFLDSQPGLLREAIRLLAQDVARMRSLLKDARTRENTQRAKPLKS